MEDKDALAAYNEEESVIINEPVIIDEPKGDAINEPENATMDEPE